MPELRPQPLLTRETAPTAFALRNIVDRKARGRLRAAATAEAIGRELEWLDAEGWRYQLEAPPRVTISPKDIERAAATVDLRVWDATGTLIFRDRIHAWDGFPVLVPDGTEHEEDDGLGGKMRVSNFRESPLEAARADLAHTVRVVTKGGKSPWVKAKPGTVSTFYAGTEDGRIQSDDATYATARSGPADSVNTGAANSIIGQRLSGTYTVWEGAEQWDTSAISDSDTVSGVTVSLWGLTDVSDTDFTLEVRASDWGATLTVDDYVAGASLGALTRLATLPTSGFSTGAYNDFAEDGTNFRSAINLTGPTRVIIASDRTAAGTTPTGLEYVTTSTADEAGTTQDPKLVVTHAPTETLPTGAPVAIQFTGTVSTYSSVIPIAAGVPADIQVEGFGSTFTMQVLAGIPADIQFTGTVSTYLLVIPIAAGAPAEITWQGFTSTIATVDMVVEVSLSNLSGDTDEECGVVFRLGNATNFLAAYVDDGDNLVHLSAFEGGVERSIATAAWTPADTAEIRVICQSDRIRVWVDRVLLIDVEDGWLVYANRAGLFSRSTAVVKYSDFYAQLLSEVA